MLIIAHRGASDLLPDNTLLSFDQALVEKADMIELDVRQTADGQLVLCHDKYLPDDYKPSISDISAHQPVAKISYQELKLCCKQNGFDLATLEEVLASYGGKIAIIIEIKEPGYEKEIVDLVYKYNLSESVIFSSFILRVILKLKDIDSSLKVGWIIDQWRILRTGVPAWMLLSKAFSGLNINAAYLHYRNINQDVVSRFRSISIPVYAWTVNDQKKMKHLIDLGVDGIITNKPSLLYTILSGIAEHNVNPASTKSANR